MRCLFLNFLWLHISICGILDSIIALEGDQDIKNISLDSLLHIQVSTAAKYEQKISEAPASVSIITSEEIERYGYRTLDEVLVSVRGFYTRNDRNYVYLGVRGFSRPGDFDNRILLLLNGHTMNENSYGSAAIGTDFCLDLDAIERVEIVRGPGSALYGTNAMFSVINVITRKGNMVDGIKLSAELGSYGKLQGSVAFGKKFDNGLELFFSSLWGDIKGQDLYFEEYDDSSTNNGMAENLDWDKYYGLLTRITYDEFTLQGILTSRKKGIPTAAWDMVFNDDAAQSLDERRFMELKYDHDLSADKYIMLRGYVDHYHYWGSYPYYEDESSSNIINHHDATDGNWLGTEGQFRWDLRSNNRLIIGVEYQNHLHTDYRYWAADTTYFDGNFPFKVLSIYLQDEYQVRENLSFTLGIRRDEYSTVGSATTPRGAIIYNPIRSGTLKLLYGEAFRAPNVYEVNYEDPVSGYKANPVLQPEKISTRELIWEQRLSDELFGTVSLYNYEMKNLIDQIMDPADSLFQFQNVSRVKAKGIELELNARLKRGLWGYVNYIWQHAEDADSKEKLTNSPSQIIKTGVSYPVVSQFYAAAELQYETERITVYGTKSNPYLLFNVNLSTKQWFHHFRLSLMIRNVFNVSYQLPGCFEHKQHAIPQNGRNFNVKLECKL